MKLAGGLQNTVLPEMVRDAPAAKGRTELSVEFIGRVVFPEIWAG
jgi:hypothetical protein